MKLVRLWHVSMRLILTGLAGYGFSEIAAQSPQSKQQILAYFSEMQASRLLTRDNRQLLPVQVNYVNEIDFSGDESAELVMQYQNTANAAENSYLMLFVSDAWKRVAFASEGSLTIRSLSPGHISIATENSAGKTEVSSRYYLANSFFYELPRQWEGNSRVRDYLSSLSSNLEPLARSEEFNSFRSNLCFFVSRSRIQGETPESIVKGIEDRLIAFNQWEESRDNFDSLLTEFWNRYNKYLICDAELDYPVQHILTRIMDAGLGYIVLVDWLLDENENKENRFDIQANTVFADFNGGPRLMTLLDHIDNRLEELAASNSRAVGIEQYAGSLRDTRDLMIEFFDGKRFSEL